MRYYIIAGEASGDLHGSNLMAAIKAKDALSNFRFWGGALMHQEGGTMVKHYKDLAFMGFAEVVANLPTIINNLNFCKEDVQSFKPDVLILIDYPGFNLRIADFAKSIGLRVFYYITPQVWAWHSSRVKKMKTYIDKMFVILPFEKEYFYKEWNWEVDFVGHPLLDALENEKQKFQKITKSELGLNPSKPLIALLPGSRKQEVSRVLPHMLSAVQNFPNFQFAIAGAPSLDLIVYQSFAQEIEIPIIQNQTYALLHLADAALVTSGTATLETALIGTPQVVCYRANWLSYWIAKRLVKLNYISLVNLIMDDEVVEELIQSRLNEHEIKLALQAIINRSGKGAQMEIKYQQLVKKLGGIGASKKTADLMLKYLGFKLE